MSKIICNPYRRDDPMYAEPDAETPILRRIIAYAVAVALGATVWYWAIKGAIALVERKMQ